MRLARESHPNGPGIVVDAPLDRSPSPLSILRLPVNQREWLTISEAAEHVGRDRLTIRNWLARWVLPNTNRSSTWAHLYLRADLDRVMAAPRRGNRQIYPNFEWLHQPLASAPV